MSCPDCITGTVQTGNTVGKEVVVGELPTYVTGDEASKRVVIFGCDIFGWKFINARLLADEYGSKGFRVLIPDLFDGYEIPQWTLSARDPVNENPSFFQRVIARPLSLSIMVPFVVRNSYGTQTAKITKLVEHLRNTEPDVKIGLVGFCWGGRYAISLNHIFDATVAAHPSMVKYPDELEGVKKPISFACADGDHNYDAARAKDTEKRLKETGLTDVEIVIYQDVRHGWTIRGDMSDERKKVARDKARDQACAWFAKYLT